MNSQRLCLHFVLRVFKLLNVLKVSPTVLRTASFSRWACPLLHTWPPAWVSLANSLVKFGFGLPCFKAAPPYFGEDLPISMTLGVDEACFNSGGVKVFFFQLAARPAVRRLLLCFALGVLPVVASAVKGGTRSDSNCLFRHFCSGCPCCWCV